MRIYLPLLAVILFFSGCLNSPVNQTSTLSTSEVYQTTITSIPFSTKSLIENSATSSTNIILAQRKAANLTVDAENTLRECDKSHDERSPGCYHDVAITYNNPDLCFLGIYESHDTLFDANVCLYYVARSLNNESLCEKIPLGKEYYSRSECTRLINSTLSNRRRILDLRKTAKLDENINYELQECDNKTLNDRIGCYKNISIEANDSDLCKLGIYIEEKYMHWNEYIDGCLYDVVKALEYNKRQKRWLDARATISNLSKEMGNEFQKCDDIKQYNSIWYQKQEQPPSEIRTFISEKQKCYANISLEHKNPDICWLVEFPEVCFTTVAQLSRNQSICDNIIEDSLIANDYHKPNCHRSVENILLS